VAAARKFPLLSSGLGGEGRGGESIRGSEVNGVSEIAEERGEVEGEKREPWRAKMKGRRGKKREKLWSKYLSGNAVHH